MMWKFKGAVAVFLIQGRRKDGGIAYVGSDPEGHRFADEPMEASFIRSARSAKAMLASVPRMATYYRGDRMEMGSFALHRAEVETKPVAISEDVRTKLAGGRSAAPQGWRFLIVDEAGERFATPRRHWSKSTASLDEAVALHDLGSAVEIMDEMEEGWRIVVVHLVVQPEPVSAQELETALADEIEVAAPKPDEDLSGEAVFTPRF
ncbi:hypothetical protein [Methylobacterium brachiatum]